MSPAASLSPLFFLFLLTVFLYLSSAGSEMLDSTGHGNDSPCVVPHDGDKFCPVKCFRSDPVCGENGVTYWCGCPDAACAGVRVAKNGPCEVGNGGNGLVSGQAFFLIHIVWLIILGFSVLFGFF
ncbi:uncharacterized protein LOC110110598 [Dendrobium catenatum]|uniref:uncharacterized protein LOC110110598 n=1 Tax=Dendrobium catenatum TaxID=906689 RepID=UPI0009F4C5AC|nr:uncharacterized protein LOC110110598 [Dendrobium catenatum]